MNFIALLHFVADFYFVFVMTAAFIAAIVYTVIQLFKDKDKGEDERLQNRGESTERKNGLSETRISHNLALGYVETLEGAFGVDPEYYDPKYSGAIQGLKFYIAQNAKDDADR